MLYERELQFLREALKKSHVSSYIVSPKETLAKALNGEMLPLFALSPDANTPISLIPETLEDKTVYKFTDHFYLTYIFMLLPERNDKNLFLIGPYSSVHTKRSQVLEIAEKYGVAPKDMATLEKYYSNIVSITESSHLFVMLDVLCDIIWDGEGYNSVDINREKRSPVSPINGQDGNVELDDILINMKMMEKRYAYENELMRAVSQGQTQKVNVMLSNFSEFMFEKRAMDDLRNMKNYCIIMNTLLRKAAENGGVHPMYLDKTSSGFAIKIEKITDQESIVPLMTDMYRNYCRLVRKHSMKNYSPTVQKAIILIESDLSVELSLSIIAEAQNISAGYLSSIFKKETDKTVTEYIREKRINHAKHLLATTHLQIQTVALHCGIGDVQYFSKIFKKMTGMTPKEYRESVK